MAAERVLTHETHRQDTPYFCGPAATRTALSVRGIVVSESTLASHLRTTTAGTNSTADIVRGINTYVGTVYAAVYIGGQTATPAQTNKFRADLVTSVDRGYAIVANVVGTGRDINGRSYAYSGGHYVAVVGYRKSGSEALVSDVAIGQDYWMSTDALAVWIAGRGYAWAANGANGRADMTVDDLLRADEIPNDINPGKENEPGYNPFMTVRWALRYATHGTLAHREAKAARQKLDEIAKKVDALDAKMGRIQAPKIDYDQLAAALLRRIAG